MRNQGESASERVLDSKSVLACLPGSGNDILRVDVAFTPISRASLVASRVRDVARRSWSSGRTQLRMAQLASANRHKDEFLATLSHELRSPLAALDYALRFLSSDTIETVARHKTQALMARQLNRMRELIDGLLDVSRVSTGQVHLHCERVDLRGIVSNAIETLQSDIHARKHRLSSVLPDEPVWLWGDAGRLEQVFVNLLANACRYTDAGGQISVWLHTRKGQAIVRVRDSGIGIAPGAMPGLFDLFVQADAADPRSKPGQGIGLSVVRELVELHGGTVTAGSGGCGLGSEFTVRLPTDDHTKALAPSL